MFKNLKLGTKIILGFLAVVGCLMAQVCSAAAVKPSPDSAISMLKEGNERFVSGNTKHPNTTAARLAQAGSENQGDHAYATIITCSDSRVPVERLFDAGVMDIFVIRVAGNVCDTDEVGSIEYGLAHVRTPVLVVLGHTQCGAVTAVTHAIHGTGHALERNIPPLVDNIQPAVERAIQKQSHLNGDAVIPYAIEENVWQGIEDLFINSPSTRNIVNSGRAKVVGAIYDVGTGRVRWLPEHKSMQILASVESNPARAMNAMAGGSHGGQSGSHGGNAASGSSNGGSTHSAIEVQAKQVTLIDPSKLHQLDAARHRKIEIAQAGLGSDEGGASILWKVGIVIAVILVLTGLAWQSGVFTRMAISSKLYASFGILVLIAVFTGLCGYYFLKQVSTDAKIEASVQELNIMANEMATLQNEFLLYGIEDKQRGEECVKRIEELVAEYKTDAADIRALHLDEVGRQTITEIEQAVDKFETVFVDLTNKFHEVEQYKEDLDVIYEKVEEELAKVLLNHESELAEMEHSGADATAIAFQTELVEKLAKCELLVAKIAHDEVAFLLDKHIDRVAEMETKFGLLYPTLNAVKSIVPKVAIDKAEETADLAMISTVYEQMHEYQKELAKIIEDELQVEADTIDASEDLMIAETTCEAMATRIGQQVENIKAQANTISIFLIIGSAVFGTFLSITLVLSITKPINSIITGLTEGSEQVSSASGQVSAASQSLAEGSTEQAAGLEETSSSLEEMASMTKQNADNAQQANTLAGQARTAADTGTESMTKMNEAINDIQKSSDETAKIIKVIDEIAFQTNLLALNAAVEAARAGEAGKGFAVVAEEVRNLAMRSAEAAKNTSAMIEESVKNSKNGVDIATEVAKVLEEIVGSIGKTTDLVGEIAAASQEQAQGIDQINTAMAQMDKVTQQNAANAEESASASEELSAQAESMNDQVGELVTLVGGAANRHSRSSGRGRNFNRGAAQKASNNTKQHSFGKSDHAFHKIANGHAQEKAPRQTAKASAPEKVIPLKGDENTGTDDFNEFNG